MTVSHKTLVVLNVIIISIFKSLTTEQWLIFERLLALFTRQHVYDVQSLPSDVCSNGEPQLGGSNIIPNTFSCQLITAAQLETKPVH